MKRIRLSVICMSLLATLSMVGCTCTPGYYSGMPQYAYHPNDMVGCDTGCDPCGPAETSCGVIEYGGNFCAPPRTANCRTSFSHIGNGLCLVGRGVLDVAAAPFVAIGGILSSGCRYEVITHCDTPFYGRCYPVQEIAEPCSPCSSGCSTGCDNCAGGYTEGIQYNTNVLSRPTTFQPAFSPRRNSVIQASYQEPNAPAVRFVQPR